MEQKSREQQIDEHVTFLQVVCGALVVSVGIYAVAAWYLVDGPGQIRPLAELPMAAVALVALAGLALVFVAPVVRRRMLERGDHPTAEGDAMAALESHRLATLLAFLLREGTALMGLVLSLLTGNVAWCFGLCAVALVAMFSGWPRREDLTEALAMRGGEVRAG